MITFIHQSTKDRPLHLQTRYHHSVDTTTQTRLRCVPFLRFLFERQTAIRELLPICPSGVEWWTLRAQTRTQRDALRLRRHTLLASEWRGMTAVGAQSDGMDALASRIRRFRRQ